MHSWLTRPAYKRIVRLKATESIMQAPSTASQPHRLHKGYARKMTFKVTCVHT